MRFLRGHPLDTETITQTEKHFGFVLPRAFKEIALAYSKGHPQEGSFIFKSNDTKYNISYFGEVISFDPNDSYPISEIIETIGLEEGLIPFAGTGFGDYICFDYRADPTTDNPPVVYWAHEFTDINDGISFLAKDFDTFLGMLMSSEEAEAALEKLNARN